MIIIRNLGAEAYIPAPPHAINSLSQQIRADNCVTQFLLLRSQLIESYSLDGSASGSAGETYWLIVGLSRARNVSARRKASVTSEYVGLT